MDEGLARRIAAMLDAGIGIQTVALDCGVTEYDVWNAMALVASLDFPPGTRVRIIEDLVPLRLRSSYGTVVGPDRYGGYVVIRLSEPAIDPREHESLGEIWDVVVMMDNLERLDEPQVSRD